MGTSTSVLKMGIAVAAMAVGSASATVYYVDGSAGSNGNGTYGAPWNAVSSVNTPTFAAGDSILFKRGTTCLGEVQPKGSGNAGAQITIGAFGTGELPIIDAQGVANTAGIRLANVEYWTVADVEVRNNATTVASRWGIYVFENDGTVKHRVIIRNTVVRNVYASSNHNGSPTFYPVGGIYVKVSEPGRMDSVVIDGNHVFDIVGEGICFWGESEMSGGGMNWNNLSTNVIVRNNRVIRTGADGILTLGTDNVLIEGNLVDSAGRLGTSATEFIAGLWPTRHRNGIVQYNEVSHTKTWTGDGQSFDNDLYVLGSTIFQYNYSHDNDGGFFLDCCAPDGSNTGTIIRYNISQNDGSPWYMSLQKGIAKVYNNAFYRSGIGPIKIDGATNNRFYNNIFYANVLFSNNNILDHNAYFGGLAASSSDSNKVTANPLLAGPGTGGSGMNTLDGYKLQAGSPCIGAGTRISGMPAQDFWGNPILATGPIDIGPFQFTGSTHVTSRRSATIRAAAGPAPSRVYGLTGRLLNASAAAGNTVYVRVVPGLGQARLVLSSCRD
jgi:hypothetical protein